MKFKKFIKESFENTSKHCVECDSQLTENDSFSEYDKIEEKLSNLEKLKRAFPELNFENSYTEEVIKEDLSNWEKLVRAYPELDTYESEIIHEELSNIEKLKAAYPELNFDNHIAEKDTLNEATGADTAHAVKDAMDRIAKDDSKQWAKTASEIISIIPDNLADELFDAAKTKLSNIRLNGTTKKNISSNLGLEIDENKDTVGELFDYAEKETGVKKNPELTKTFIITVLSVIAIIEPTPVVEILTLIISALPADLIASVLDIIAKLNPAVITGNFIKNSINNKNQQKQEVAESFEEDTYFDEYDDDYSFDDVEEDRAHAALYGGDLTYCRHCGTKLKRNEWGGYCPECDGEPELDDNI